MKWKQDRIQPCQNWLLNRVSTVQFCCARTDYASILSLLCINWKIPSSHRSQRAFLQNFRHMKMIGTIDFWDKDSIRHSLWYCHNYCTVTVTNDRYVSQSIHLLRQAESFNFDVALHGCWAAWQFTIASVLWSTNALVCCYSTHCRELVAHSHDQQLQGVTPKDDCNPALDIVGGLVGSLGPATIHNNGDAGNSLVETVRDNCMLFLFLGNFQHR